MLYNIIIILYVHDDIKYSSLSKFHRLFYFVKRNTYNVNVIYLYVNRDVYCFDIEISSQQNENAIVCHRLFTSFVNNRQLFGLGTFLTLKITSGVPM